MTALERIFKKYSDRLIEVHTEDDDGIQYWGTLKSGWQSNLECRLVHEDNLKQFELEIKYSKLIKNEKR